LCLLATCALSAGDLSGRRAPGFSLPDSNLKQYDIADYRGRIVVIDIMKTDCPHCRTLSAVLEKVKVKYGDKVVVLSVVNPPDNTATVAKYIAEVKVTSPMLFDCGQMAASYLKVTPSNPRVSVPHVFVIDGRGMIRDDYAYDLPNKHIFEGQGLYPVIDKLLAAGAGGAKKR